ncbi:hypothetical protein CLOSTMETH_02326 [[Clostridium] methylpentosum DSM 5476]|uniref:Uncharacterized protein n=1 Tax=[Clostridium] methylpentosum DSM 5476 TaxID=537013 RepID=C0EEN7_9FIRM|nr:hypothetical protein CLOSTMETH_02326 [[Clostridium] methylpentosum DSM 5476]
MHFSYCIHTILLFLYYSHFAAPCSFQIARSSKRSSFFCVIGTSLLLNHSPYVVFFVYKKQREQLPLF